MKTKEEILKEATKRTLNINEGSPLHDAVMKAMEEYAQEQVKLFCQPAVVGRSEQLKAFREWWNKDNGGVCTTITHKDIERYLESL